MGRTTRLLHWIIALCGLWEFGDIAAPFTPGFGVVPAFLWNHIIVGFCLVIIGAWAALTSNAGAAKRLDQVAVVAGGWLIAASFILGRPDIDVGLWNDIIVGALVVILASAAWLRLRPRR